MRDTLLKMYSEVSNYDRHYSVVRTSTSTFLVSLGLFISTFFLESEELFLSVFVPGLIFIAAIFLNIHFQRLTYCCRKVEEQIENEVASSFSTPYVPNTDLLKFRHKLSEEFHKSKFTIDLPSILVIIFAIFYLSAVLVRHNYSYLKTLIFTSC